MRLLAGFERFGWLVLCHFRHDCHSPLPRVSKDLILIGFDLDILIEERGDAQSLYRGR